MLSLYNTKETQFFINFITLPIFLLYHEIFSLLIIFIINPIN